MQFLNDWKFWLFTINILILIFNWFSHQKIVGNDLKHLAEDVKEVKTEQTCIKIKMIELGEQVGYLKGKVETK